MWWSGSPWKRRPQAALLLGVLKRPDRGFDAVVIGEPQRAFYGNQFGLTFPVFGIPPQLRRTLTGDRGREMAEHGTITTETGMPIYLCKPRSPWQRGTNENTNRLLRQYLLKGTDLRRFSQADLDAIAHELNHRPRKTHAYRTPAEVYADLLNSGDALTA